MIPKLIDLKDERLIAILAVYLNLDKETISEVWITLETNEKKINTKTRRVR